MGSSVGVGGFIVLGAAGVALAVAGWQAGAIAIWTLLTIAAGAVFVATRRGPRRLVRRSRRISFSRAAPQASPSAAVARPPAPRRLTSARATIPENQEAPALSIVMPVYNVAPYLESALLSVLYQEFQDFELIVVDDASTDDSRRIVDMFAAADPRIRVIGLEHNTLGGAGIPSNVGIRAARGTYLAFADSDDIVTRAGIARLIDAAEQSQADIVIGDFTTFAADSRELSEAYDRHRSAPIPRGELISASTYPELLELSPVPWRKLYRRSFMEEFGIEYPEGDFFFEDNPLHWTVLALADRVVFTDYVVSSHRLGREGQTMASLEYRKAAYAHHFSTALQAVLATTGERRDALLGAFVERLYASRWVIREQKQVGAQAMVAKRFAMLFDRAAAAGAKIPTAMKATVGTYRASYPHMDLTVVLACHNCAPQVRRTLDSLLSVAGVDLDILAIDDGSTDNTLSILREYESAHGNVHVFTQTHRGAGRARNAVIPLITGRSAFFMEPGDLVDPPALAEAVRVAERQNADLLFVEDSTAHADVAIPSGSAAEVDPLSPSGLSDGAARRRAAMLGESPWRWLIRTDLLHDSNIFFGSTAAYADLLYHWHAVAAASVTGFSSIRVVTRKNFTMKRQATRMSRSSPRDAIEAVRATHERIAAEEGFADIRACWIEYADQLLRSVAERVDSDRDAFDHEAAKLLSAFDPATTATVKPQ